MAELLLHPVLGIVISIAAYRAGQYAQRKLATPLANPLIIGAAIILLIIHFTPLELGGYQKGGHIITMFIVPATTVLAVLIQRQWSVLKDNIVTVLAACSAGSIASIGSVWGMCRLLGIDGTLLVSLLPKSVTTAIALELSGKNGGIIAVTVVAVITTGIMTAVLSPLLIKICKLKDSVSIGLAMGTAGHAIGTAKAIEYGEVEGAMSGIALCISGIITSVLFIFLL